MLRTFYVAPLLRFDCCFARVTLGFIFQNVHRVHGGYFQIIWLITVLIWYYMVLIWFYRLLIWLYMVCIWFTLFLYDLIWFSYGCPPKLGNIQVIWGNQRSFQNLYIYIRRIPRRTPRGCWKKRCPETYIYIYIYTAHTPAHTPSSSIWPENRKTNRARRIPSAHTRRMPSRAVFRPWVPTGRFGPGAYPPAHTPIWRPFGT